MLGDLILRKSLSILLIVLVLLIPIGCESITLTESRAEIKINMPKDDTVNGYRTESVAVNNSNTIPADKVGVESQKPSKTSSEVKGSSFAEHIQYCANTNSKIFHKTDCGSAKNLKEENKYITSNREELMLDGYTPCKKCNP